MRIQYKHPKLYDFLIRFLYTKKLNRRLRELVGTRKSVFDVAAGYGRVAKHLDPSVTYRGIDLNEIFVKHGRKQGREITVNDALDESAYVESDVVLLVDIVHHLKPDALKTLFRNVFTHAKEKVIVVEPAFVSLVHHYGVFGKIWGWLFTLIDDDGINHIDHWFTDEEYDRLFETRFGVAEGKTFDMSYEHVAGHHLVTFTRLPA